MVSRPKNLTESERNVVVQFILQGSSGGKPMRGRLVEARTRFGVSKSTVTRLWKQARDQQAKGSAVHLISKKKGRIRDHNMKPDYVQFKALHVHDRSSFRAMEAVLDVSKATLQRWWKAGLFKACSSSIKPSLTAANKFLRMRFSLEYLELDRVMNTLRYSSMHNIVHMDEKWFYITKEKRRYYLAPDEEEPYRACKSKKFIGKIMFLCAVSRPILNEDGAVSFDGKIGCFPFITQEVAKKNSKYRPKGTPYIKATESITREVIKECIINQVPIRNVLLLLCLHPEYILTLVSFKQCHKVLPAIKQKWPSNASKQIYIQQDNAKPHITDSDTDFRLAASADGFNIRLIQQPPNSPDTNINDLGFFNAIQSLQHKRLCKTVDDLVNAVQDAFQELPAMTLNKVFLTLQGVLTEIMKVKGHNNYKIPHMGKDRLIREGTLPVSLTIPVDLARESIHYLVQNGQINGIDNLVQRLGMQQLTGLESAFANTSII